MEYKNTKNESSQFEVEGKISELRLKLNKAIESNIDKSEIVNISQELDKYIVLKQKKLGGEKYGSK
ncbi:MAG: aspartyl-phosphate phosphatase Spo0E family protein [Maledivibacter sp.]|jgi:hypothetical protein|nr:aspartyl-phosphate phosphatase Spo0E family protein [Maledivibacter sp.]